MLNEKEVKHIAKLARLGLSEEEAERFKKELSSILDYIEKLKEVDVSGVEPTTHPHLIENVAREDVIQKQEPEKVNELVEVAPEREERYVRVKAVL